MVELNALYAITRLLGERQHRIETQFGEVLGVLSSFLGLCRPAVVIVDDDRRPSLSIGAGRSQRDPGVGYPGVGWGQPALPRRAIACVAAMQMPVALADIRRSKLFAVENVAGWGPDRRAPMSWIGIPILVDEGLFGILVASRMGLPSRRLCDDLSFLTAVARLLAQNLQARRAHQAVSQAKPASLPSPTVRAGSAIRGPHPDAPAAADMGDIIGGSPAARKAMNAVRTAARTKSTVMLRGETGTGKEVFANCVHRLSPRAKRPFVKLNCAAVPETMLESELFGHERGAFTGALTQRKGRFELADGGTLFLDEIGEISAAFQVKLLRVLQEKEFERVGGSKTISVDVRLVCATNRNLEEAVAAGTFRADLYYRINVVPILLPPLRERQGDIVPLATEFLRQFNAENGTSLNFSQKFLQSLFNRTYDGNIRELRNLVFRAATFAMDSDVVVADNEDNGASPGPAEAEMSAFAFDTPSPMPDPVAAGPAEAQNADEHAPAGEPDGGRHNALHERERLIDAMKKAGWVQAKAARLLGITPRQVGYALRKHDIEINRF